MIELLIGFIFGFYVAVLVCFIFTELVHKKEKNL